MPTTEAAESVQTHRLDTRALLEVLEYVPDSSRFVWFTDWSRAGRKLGVECDDDDPGDWLGELTNPSNAAVPIPQVLISTLREPSDLQTSFGVGVCDVAASATTWDGDQVLDVFHTTRSPDAIVESIADDPVWGPELRTGEVDDGTLHERLGVARTSCARGPPRSVRSAAPTVSS